MIQYLGPSQVRPFAPPGKTIWNDRLAIVSSRVATMERQSRIRKEPVKMSQENCTWVGMDVHKKNIVVALMAATGSELEAWEVPNNRQGVRRLIKKLKAKQSVRCCYEAGPCGFKLQRELVKAGLPCAVIAPSLIPTRSGDRVKTDRRDAKKLAKLYRADLLTEVHPPTEAEEAVRDLTRCREDAKADQKRARHRLEKFLLRRGVRYGAGKKQWTLRYYQWLKSLKLDEPVAQQVFDDYLFQVEQQDARLARLDEQIVDVSQQDPYKEQVGWLRCFRGIDTLTAMGYITELFSIERFDTARGLMAFVGQVPSESTSGDQVRRGGLTKTGNGHVRRLLTENAQHYRHHPAIGVGLKKRRQGQPSWAISIADRAQRRLNHRYWHLVTKGKAHNKAISAVGRELVGFIWAALLEGQQRRANEAAGARQ